MNCKYHNLIQPKLPEVAKLLNSGSSVSATAAHLGISITTLRRYRKLYPEFNELFEQHKDICDDMVEAALLKRATGYEDSNGKEIAPDVRAALFWLQNRRPKKWKKNSANQKKQTKKNVPVQLIPVEAQL